METDDNMEDRTEIMDYEHDDEEEEDREEDQRENVNAPIKCFLKKYPYCRLYYTRSNLVRHKKTVHPNRIIKSSHHKEKYVRKFTVKNQMKIYVCPETCGKAFCHKDSLKRHKESKDCYFNCNYMCCFCHKMFQSQEKYWNHLNFRRCPKQFPCTQCFAFFKQRSRNFIMLKIVS